MLGSKVNWYQEIWLGSRFIAENAFVNYEVSAYAKEQANANSKQCEHNRNYWQFGDYLGIGAGAHSKITDVNSGEIIRLVKHKHPKAYLNAENYIIQQEVISENQLPFEFMLNALRLQEAIPYDLFTMRTGLKINAIKQLLLAAKNKGLLLMEDDCFYPSKLGRRFLNDLVALFLS